MSSLASASAAAAPPAPSSVYDGKPTVVIVIGMAGSGKTTLLSRLYRHLSVEKNRARSVKVPSSDDAADGKPPASSSSASSSAPSPSSSSSSSAAPPLPATGYYMNLDPAVTSMPFPPQIDIRDTVDYKGVMSSYKLGPNGAILTCLNLFATRFDQVLGILEKRSASEKPEDKVDYVIVDTPGQIESFTWSSSGQIFTESLSSSYPTVLVFVVDTPRTSNPNTFMSNMLYACSIMYRSRLPLLLAFNKSDVLPPSFAFSWMQDYEAFQTAIDDAASAGGQPDGGGYYSSLTRSMALALDEFYGNIQSVGVSAATGDGVEEMFDKIDACREDFMEGFARDIELRKAEARARKEAEGMASIKRLEADLEEDNRERERREKEKLGEK